MLRSHDTTAPPLGQPLFVTVPAAAKMIGISRSLAYDWINSGTLRHIRRRGHILVPLQAIHEMADEAMHQAS